MHLSSTRLSAFCAKLIEAGWLAAIVVTPLYFNVYSSRVFEPDKIAVLRSIAVLMLAAWLVKSVEEISHGRPALRFSWRTPLVLPALAVIAVCLLSTLTSVTPYTSLWGSYQRSQGAYTRMACIVIFFIILNEMSSREQFDRLITVVILTSVPISLYALIQHYKLEAFPGVTSYSTATLGNTTFLAAYQLMVFFLTVGRVVEELVTCLGGREDVRVINSVRPASYIVIATLQFIVICFTASRGAWIGWMVGVFTFVLMGVLKLRCTLPNWRIGKWLGLSWVVLGILVVVFLIVVNLPDSPLSPVLRQPYQWMFQVLDVRSGEGKVHTLLWEGAVQLVGWHDPISWPGGKPDALNAVRPFIGYGPESIYVTYGRFYPPNLAHYEARNAMPDRTFSVVFDTLITGGALGLGAYLLLVSSVFYYGCRWLGWIGSRRDRTVWWVLWSGGGAVGALVPLVLHKPNFLGVGLPFGMIGGLILYLISHAVKAPQDHRRWITLAALVSTILAHLAEISSGLAIAATYLYFWVYAGLLVVLGARLADQPTAIAASETPTSGQDFPHPDCARFSLPAWVAPTLVYALVCALILGTLGYEFITNTERLVDPIRIVWRALIASAPRYRGRTLYGVLGMFVLTWLAGGLVALVESERDKAWHTLKSLVGGALVYCVASAGPATVFAVSLASFLGSLTQVQASTIDEVVQIAQQVAHVLDYYYAYVLLVIFSLGGLLMMQSHRPGMPLAGRVGALFALPVLVLAGAIVTFTNLNPIRADVIYKQADPWDKQGQWDVSIAHYQRAIDLSPTEDFYYLWMGRALLEKATQTQNSEGQLLAEQTRADTVLKMDTGQIARLCQQDLLITTRAVLERAREINPLNADHSANLARLYRRWADLAQTPDEQQKRADQSIAHYQDAVHLSPNNAVLWNEWATVYLELKNEPETALQKLNRSLELDDRYIQTYMILGDVYVNQQRLDEAAEAYGHAFEIAPRSKQALHALCPIYVQQNKLDEAIACSRDLAEIAPRDWNAYKTLASLLDQKGELDQALSNARTARRLAPKEQWLALDMYIVQLQIRLARSPWFTP